MTEILVPRRFCGPPSSGNGGWSAGALAAVTVERADHADPWPAITVALHQPPPLDTELPVSTEDGWTLATYGGSTVGRARVADHELTEVPAVSADDARAATAGYRGFGSHPFPTCFTCGTGREEGDGLRIFPGDVAGDELARVAAPWTPHPSVAEDWHCLPRGGPRRVGPGHLGGARLRRRLVLQHRGATDGARHHHAAPRLAAPDR